MNRISTHTLLILNLLMVCNSRAYSQDFVDHAQDMGVISIISSSTNGNGLSTYDFNRDGLDDISLCGQGGPLYFYQNTETGMELTTFGLSTEGIAEHLLWVDYDNDNHLDVFVTTLQGRMYLYRNSGDFTFDDVTASAGLALYNANYYGAAFGDYDLDGDLDLYVSKYLVAPYNPDNTSQPNKLYQNQGNGTFIDVTTSSLIFMPPTFSFQPTWFDYNGDNWPDLFVINDRAPANFLFKNNGNGTFTEVATSANVRFQAHDIMSNSLADFDHDGDLDIYMTNTGVVNQGTRSMFSVNQGNGVFIESAVQYGIGAFVPGWGAVWIDSNNDSWQDLLFATDVGWPTYYYKSNEGQSFTQANDLVSVAQNSPSYGASSGDFNNDGYADVAIQRKAPHFPYVLINQGGSNNYIKITLAGTISNSQAIGSWVEVYNSGEVYSQYTLCGENYLGQNSQHLIFGLGSEVSSVDSVKVKYPSGIIDVYYNLSSDSAYYLTEGETYSVNIQPTYEIGICQGDSILLDAGEHESYFWNTGDTSRYIYAHNAQTYTVIATNSFGISASDSVNVLNHPLPILSANIQNPLCHNDSTGSIELYNLTMVPLDSVVWAPLNFGSAIDSLSAGTYTYLASDINGCTSQGYTTLIDPPSTEFFTVSTPKTQGEGDGTISISIFGGTPPFEVYLDGELVGTKLTGLNSGVYTFYIYDANLCMDSLTVFVDFISNIYEINSSSIKVFPNPTEGIICIQSETVLLNIQVLDLAGKCIKELEYIENCQYAIEELKTGIYFIRILDANNQSSVHRIVKL